MTLGEWIPIYLESYKKGTIKPRSYEIIELVSRKISPELLAMPLDEILPMHLQKFYNEFSRTCSKSYMDKMRVLMHELFETAQDNGFCEKNPTLRLKVPKIKEKRRESFSADEVREIISFAMTYDDKRTAVAIITLLLTGLRRGELLAIKAEDIKDTILEVRRAIYLNGNKAVVEEGVAKTEGSIRTIVLMPEVAQLLLTLPHKGEYIFSTKNGTLLHPRNFNRDYERFFKCLHEACGIRYLSPHCCRHTFATLSLASGANLSAVAGILGHTNIKTTSRYTHPDTKSKEEAVQQMRSTLFEKQTFDN